MFSTLAVWFPEMSQYILLTNATVKFTIWKWCRFLIHIRSVQINLKKSHTPTWHKYLNTFFLTILTFNAHKFPSNKHPPLKQTSAITNVTRKISGKSFIYWKGSSNISNIFSSTPNFLRTHQKAKLRLHSFSVNEHKVPRSYKNSPESRVSSYEKAKHKSKFYHTSIYPEKSRSHNQYYTVTYLCRKKKKKLKTVPVMYSPRQDRYMWFP